MTEARDAPAEHELLAQRRRASAMGSEGGEAMAGPHTVTSSGARGAVPTAARTVQLFATAVNAGIHDLHAAAAAGIRGPGGELPHLAAIQRAFGKHDISGIRAHVGGAAATASEAIGANAYATGADVAFASAPDLHLAAHEAAHVVQQRGGVQLDGGVGAVGDPYEQHADAVAALVVAGRSAEAELDRHAGGSAGRGASNPIQMSRRPEHMAYAMRGRERQVTSASQTFVLVDAAARTLEGLRGPLDDDLVGWMVMSGRAGGAPGADRGPSLIAGSSNLQALWESSLRHAPAGPIEICAELVRDDHGTVTFVRFSTPGFTHLEFEDERVEARPLEVHMPSFRVHPRSAGGGPGALDVLSGIADATGGGSGIADITHGVAADALERSCDADIEAEVARRLEARRSEAERLYREDPTAPIYATIVTHRSRVHSTRMGPEGSGEVTAGRALDDVHLGRTDLHGTVTEARDDLAIGNQVVVTTTTVSLPIRVGRGGDPETSPAPRPRDEPRR